MADGKSRLGFNLPDQQKPGKDSFDTRPKRVEAWIAQLPMGNVGETARLVFSALHESNRLRISWQDRYRMLEALRPAVAFISQALHKRFLGLAMPLPPKTQRIAALATELYNEMALGYKAAIEDMLAANVLFRDKRALCIMLHRALRYLNQVLLTTYQVYSPQPHDTWSDIHRLYRYAEEKKLQQTSVTDKEQALLAKSSIATVYKQALLLALATPYRLRQGEVTVIYSALELWSHLAQIQPFDANARHDAPIFVAHLSSNSEPSHVSFSHFDCADGECRIVNLERLLLTVQDEQGQAERGVTTELKQRLGKGISVDLLRRLSLTWGVPPKRGFYRNAHSAQVEVVVGMTAVHRALGLVTALRSMTSSVPLANAGPEGLFSKTSTFASRSVASVSDKKEDVWELFKKAPSPRTPSKEPPKSEPKTPPLQMQTWDIRDESAGGYRIARHGDDTLGVQVGDLIGVRLLTDTHDGDWTIGVVRWIRHGDAMELEMGIQNMATRARPAAARMRQPNGHLTEYQRVIGLPERKEPERSQTLLTPPVMFAVGNTILVQFDGGGHSLMLTGLLENTGSFAQFTFEDLGSAAGSPPASKAPTLPPEFNSLWSDL